MSVAANLCAITGGILVFGETIGKGGLGITARVVAFGVVIAGAALVPAPLRANSGAAHPDADRTHAARVIESGSASRP